MIRTLANASSVVDLILQNNDVWDFQILMQGYPYTSSMGVHSAGHFAMGGDPGRDLWSNSGDPAFYLHHAMADRVWWMWQNLDRNNRLFAISGTGTAMNDPPSANTTLDTITDLGYAAGSPTPMRDLMSTTDNLFCYVYV
jgi:tyrosinase